MLRMIWARSSLAILVALMGALSTSPAAYAQNSARLSGVVTGPDGDPVAGASITITFTGGLAREYVVTTNDAGEFLQMGLIRGPYSVLAIKEGVGALTGIVTLAVAQEFEMDMTLLAPDEIIRESLTEEQLAIVDAAEAAEAAFGEALEATRGGHLDQAIELFNAALVDSPECADCHRNLGIIYTQMEDYDRAEAAFRQALVLQPENAASYDGDLTWSTQQLR